MGFTSAGRRAGFVLFRLIFDTFPERIFPMKKSCVLLWLWLLAPVALAQTLKIEQMNPSSWFVGMKNPRVQLLLHGPNLGGSHVKVSYPGVRAESVTSTENPNYLFVDLMIEPSARPGTLLLEISKTLSLIHI